MVARVTAVLALILPCLPPSSSFAGFDYVGQWGTRGSSAGQFTNAAGIASDGQGNVYVADSDATLGRVQRFTTEGAPLPGWGTLGQFANPLQITADPIGDVYVSDSGNARVLKFNPDGTAEAPSIIGSRGSGDGQFERPAGVATDGDGNLYVADEQSGRVQKFTSDGAHLLGWDGTATPPGRFVAARDIAVDAFGVVHVLDAGSGVVSRFTGDGLYLGSYASAGQLPGQVTAPGGIAADAVGRIYVADTGNDRVQVFSAEGALLEILGATGAGDGQFTSPADVATDAGSALYVSDTGNARVEKFVELTPPIPPPAAFSTANLELVAGTVLVRQPGESRFTSLRRPQQVRLGTTIQARRGRVRLVTAQSRPRKGHPAVLQSAVFYGGSFSIRQAQAPKPIVDLELVGGDSGVCSAEQRKQFSARNARKKRKPGRTVRRLWGDGRGRYRSVGNFSASSVKGTIWLTEDRCDSTVTRVRRGVVEVRDFARKRTVRVRAGQSYTARPR